MRNFFVIKKYFTKIGDSLTYYFFNDLKIKIDNMLYYTILKLKPNISHISENTIDNIVNSNFTKKDLDLKKLYKNYIKEKAFLFLEILDIHGINVLKDIFIVEIII